VKTNKTEKKTRLVSWCEVGQVGIFFLIFSKEDFASELIINEEKRIVKAFDGW
jgi:hypothetical protein